MAKTGSQDEQATANSLLPVNAADEWIPVPVEVDGKVIDVFHLNTRTKDIMASGVDLCRAAGYEHPRSKASKEYSKNAHLLDEFSGVAKLATPSGLQETRFYINDGIHFFMMQLGKEKAKKLQLVYARIVERYRRGELQPANSQQQAVSPSDLLETSKQLVILSQNLLTSQGVMVEKVDQLQGEVNGVREQAEIANHRAVMAEQEATQALDEITKLKQLLASEADRSKLKKKVRDKMQELVELFISLGESNRVAQGQVWSVMRNKYSFLKYDEMSWLHYRPATVFLQMTIDQVKQTCQVPTLFYKRNRPLIKPEPLPLGAKN